MKRKLDKGFRIATIGLSAILVVTFLLLIYEKGVKKHNIEENKVVYEYEKTADVDYQVNLKPNGLYNMESVAEERYYVTSFTDSLDVNFIYRFQGEHSSSIEGSYDITAVIEGYENYDEVEKILWKKEYTIKEAENFKGEDAVEIIEEKVPVELITYIDYVNSFIEEAQVDFPVRLRVAMNVNLHAETPKGDVEEVSSPTIELPLNENVFTITKNNIGTDGGVVEELQTITTKVNIPVIILFFLAAVAFFLLFFYLIFFTVEIERDPLEIYIKKIFKNYGTRLVALKEDISLYKDGTFYLQTIEDLVKVADEVAMPILYRYKEDCKEIKGFYVFQEGTVYCLLAKDGLNRGPSKLERVKKKSLVMLEEPR